MHVVIVGSGSLRMMSLIAFSNCCRVCCAGGGAWLHFVPMHDYCLIGLPMLAQVRLRPHVAGRWLSSPILQDSTGEGVARLAFGPTGSEPFLARDYFPVLPKKCKF